MTSNKPMNPNDLPIELVSAPDSLPTNELLIRPAMHGGDSCLCKYLPIKDSVMFVSLGMNPALYTDMAYEKWFSYPLLILSPCELSQEEISHAVNAIKDEVDWASAPIQEDDGSGKNFVIRVAQLEAQNMLPPAPYAAVYEGQVLLLPEKEAFDRAVSIARAQAELLKRVDAMYELAAYHDKARADKAH